MGVGDQASKLAGRVYQEGKLYYIFVKPELMASESATGVIESAPEAQQPSY
jgi:hypothetical protein